MALQQQESNQTIGTVVGQMPLGQMLVGVIHDLESYWRSQTLTWIKSSHTLFFCSVSRFTQLKLDKRNVLQILFFMLTWIKWSSSRTFAVVSKYLIKRYFFEEKLSELQYLICGQQTNWLLGNSSPCVSVFLSLLCMFLSFMPLMFGAKLNIEIYFRKIIQNTQCSYSHYGTSKTLTNIHFPH